ncbi:hypothetical protein [Pelomonas sp. KK5]|uniref:hypothetical protein n=1 Tax=Pelomonas sp. KK5 TaxID=1855730 RepID=UPI001301B460|nr:hypothetical protein [Pelomonas sp. KK5]
MLDEVADDVGLLLESPELQQIVRELRMSISHRSDRQDPVVRESIASFLRLYGEGSA